MSTKSVEGVLPIGNNIITIPAGTAALSGTDNTNGTKDIPAILWMPLGSNPSEVLSQKNPFQIIQVDPSTTAFQNMFPDHALGEDKRPIVMQTALQGGPYKSAISTKTG